MTTAFVLSGGANFGAVQVGMLRALHEADVRPDVLVGTSVGAVNAAWLAGADPDAGVDGLASIWTSLRRGDVFPVRFTLGLAGFLGRRASLFDAGGLRKLIGAHIRFERLEDAPIPLHVVVTDVLDGRDVALSAGSALDVITASAAIPGVFPPVVVDGHTYMDGRYRGEVSAEGVDLTQYVRQPNQLAAAVRSPVAAIGHQHQRPVDPANVSQVEHRRTISRHVGAAVATSAVPARQNPVEESAPAGASKMNTDDHELRTPRGRAVGSATLAGADWGDE